MKPPPYTKWDFYPNDGLFATEINGVRKPIQMADPAMLKLKINNEVWFYVTGTSDEVNTRNFEFYRSKDLVNWEFARLAFPPSADCTGSARREARPHPQHSGYIELISEPRGRGDCGGSYPANVCVQPVIIDGRAFINLWSPHLHYEARQDGNDRIRLLFSAEEVQSAPTDGIGSRRTIYVAWISVTDFINYPLDCQGIQSRKYFDFHGVDRDGRLGYQLGGDRLFDGGYALSLQQFGNPLTTVPTSLNAAHQGFADGQPAPNVIERWSQQTGWRRMLTLGWFHQRSGPTGMPVQSTVLSDGPFIYVDPSPNGGTRQWLLYDWVGFEEPYPGYDEPDPTVETDDFDGNNIAAYPMAGSDSLTGLVTSDLLHIPLAYRYNVN